MYDLQELALCTSVTAKQRWCVLNMHSFWRFQQILQHHHSIPWHVTPTDASTGGITVTLPLNETSGALLLGRRRALEDIGTGSLREGNVSRQKSKRDCFQHFTGSSRTDGLDKVEHSPVLQTIEAVAAGDDLVADVALQRGVLMEDGLPIGLDGADAARDDFVEDGDDGLLGYVLRRC